MIFGTLWTGSPLDVALVFLGTAFGGYVGYRAAWAWATRRRRS